MATLDDKLLGEKLEYYCSSDEGEEESDGDDEFIDAEGGPKLETVPVPPVSSKFSESTYNTGPKGVIQDWQRFKQLEMEKREENERERIALATKFSMTCRSALDDEEDELNELFSDKILLEYAQMRMKELMAKSAPTSKFGSLIHLKTPDEYLDAVDKENKAVTVVLHVDNDSNVCCRAMNACLDELSKTYHHVKFCRMSAATAGLSYNFKAEGVPALLVYKAGELIGNFIQLSEEFGVEFTANDVDNFLIEKGIVLDKIPQTT